MAVVEVAVGVALGEREDFIESGIGTVLIRVVAENEPHRVAVADGPFEHDPVRSGHDLDVLTLVHLILNPVPGDGAVVPRGALVVGRGVIARAGAVGQHVSAGVVHLQWQLVVVDVLQLAVDLFVVPVAVVVVPHVAGELGFGSGEGLSGGEVVPVAQPPQAVGGGAGAAVVFGLHDVVHAGVEGNDRGGESRRRRRARRWLNPGDSRRQAAVGDRRARPQAECAHGSHGWRRQHRRAPHRVANIQRTDRGAVRDAEVELVARHERRASYLSGRQQRLVLHKPASGVGVDNIEKLGRT